MGVVRSMAALALACAMATGARAELPVGDTAPVDYEQASNWICRPGAGAQGVADGTCGGVLDAMKVDAGGTRTLDPFRPASDPKIDCFYVYPTTSDDPTFYSDLAADGSEKRTVHAQAARLTAACRLFAPVYHQVTSAGLNAMRDGQAAAVIGRINDIPYRDIRAAWASYLAHDNQGRGVVLIGHSQGAILLKKLIAQEVDGKPVQARLVGAYLAGNPDLTSTSFRAIRPCRASGETGCLIAWSTFPESYAGERAFGGARSGTAICVNPAAIAGGRGLLKPVLPRPSFAPESDPPLIEPVGQLSAECVTDAQGAVLRVRVEPGRYATLMGEALTHMVNTPTWGLHPRDIALTQGNVVDNIAAQSVRWVNVRR
jgi:hypothetical protein